MLGNTTLVLTAYNMNMYAKFLTLIIFYQI